MPITEIALSNMNRVTWHDVCKRVCKRTCHFGKALASQRLLYLLSRCCQLEVCGELSQYNYDEQCIGVYSVQYWNLISEPGHCGVWSVEYSRCPESRVRNIRYTSIVEVYRTFRTIAYDELNDSGCRTGVVLPWLPYHISRDVWHTRGSSST